MSSAGRSTQDVFGKQAGGTEWIVKKIERWREPQDHVLRLGRCEVVAGEKTQSMAGILNEPEAEAG